MRGHSSSALRQTGKSLINEQSMITIHREGYKFVFASLLFVIILNITAWSLFAQYALALKVLLGVSIFFFLFIAYFFRLPKFVPEIKNNNLILAPADGKIVAIEEVEEPEYFNDKRLQVSIFMSPTNVHVNRNPIGGKVVYSKYHPGNYLVAWHPKSSTLNERFTTVIQDDAQEMEILVRQIAGKLARKIENYVEEGQQVLQGTEMGFIKFGSRVDLFLPLGSKVRVELKDKVKAGTTILAELAN